MDTLTSPWATGRYILCETYGSSQEPAECSSGRSPSCRLSIETSPCPRLARRWRSCVAAAGLFVDAVVTKARPLHRMSCPHHHFLSQILHRTQILRRFESCARLITLLKCSFPTKCYLYLTSRLISFKGFVVLAFVWLLRHSSLHRSAHGPWYDHWRLTASWLLHKSNMWYLRFRWVCPIWPPQTAADSRQSAYRKAPYGLLWWSTGKLLRTVCKWPVSWCSQNLRVFETCWCAPSPGSQDTKWSLHRLLGLKSRCRSLPVAATASEPKTGWRRPARFGCGLFQWQGDEVHQISPFYIRFWIKII